MSTYLSVVKVDGVFTIKKTYYNGLNVNGNKTGALWHDARQMSLKERIEEGIYLRVDVPTEIDTAFAIFDRIDVTFDETTAEVIYKELYNMRPISEIREILKGRAADEQFRQYNFGYYIEYQGKKITLNQYTLNLIDSYSNLIAVGGSLPSDALLQYTDGTGLPLTLDILKEVIQLVNTNFKDSSQQYVRVCLDIEAAETYEEAREVAVWNGNPL